MDLLDEATRQDARALLAYREDVAGGLMNPRFARLRPEAFIDEAITYLRQQLSHVETIYYAYVLDEGQHLLGVVSLKGLVASESNKTVEEVMTTKLHKWRDWISTDRDLASGGKILRGTLPTGCSHHRAKFAWRGHFWDCDRLNVAVYFAALRVS